VPRSLRLPWPTSSNPRFEAEAVMAIERLQHQRIRLCSARWSLQPDQTHPWS
jgi:hypothetical protein